MKIKIITMTAGPWGKFLPGEEVELPDTMARDFINAGFAQAIGRQGPPEYQRQKTPPNKVAQKK